MEFAYVDTLYRSGVADRHNAFVLTLYYTVSTVKD